MAISPTRGRGLVIMRLGTSTHSRSSIHGEQFTTRKSMRQAVFEYISKRIASPLGYILPSGSKAR